ncbi:S8 family serine peptidase [Neobacillus sp. WH10]|uniref:S8 family serine peptidase n=1 Tax=Neobacillus sp. WH10 TaxID=3047873 RepID=UPI0024C201AF|nr:S8 family serine peptidase [Neobacillus sp. WH10]WHY78557.1 S8 family serine peptidase [Neobacillus sp. WH10]
MGKRRKKKIINVMAACLTTAVLLGTSTVDSFADDTNAETPTIQAPQPKENSREVDMHKITLVTGDVVTVEKYSDGNLVSTLVPSEDGTSVSFTQKTIDGDTYLIPDEATPFLAAGQMDEELFNITKLIEYGYDDSHQSSIPLIVTEESGNDAAVSESVDETVTTGAMKTVDLPSVNAVAVKTNKKHAKKFWDAVDGQANTKQAQPEPEPELTEGIKKIWLDKPVHALLDKSVPQIGAPTAWGAGYDGKGVKVAVLDTGIDPNHPDFKNSNNEYIVKEAKSFIEGQDFVDHHGHGTHVASTIAGSGAASGGKNKGVAPAAELLVGKVLSNEGDGTESGIIAGMQWAVQEKADIVSMSIGTNTPSDGTDPMSQAVNNLSETSDTLFVIAAGNAGSRKSTLGSPGAAEKALTVGAVDKSQTEFLAAFSSRGPVINNYRVKPEITAPGVGIIAARTAGTNMGTPIDDNYTSANGTSMATPHVAGAAAILKQRHPEWTGDQIKQVLAGTGVMNARYTPYQQGGGRVDVVKALDANVFSSPAVVSMGPAMVDDKPVEKSYKYVNPSDQDVTLNLALTATGENLVAAPAEMFTLNQSTVTVPAHGSSEVKVTFNPALGNVQDYKVVVNAISSDNQTINTTIGATKTEPVVRVNLQTIDRNGKKGIGEIIAANLDTGKITQIYPTSGSDTTLLLQPGRYSVMGVIKTFDETGIRTQDYTLAGEPLLELKYKEDKTITLDARLGKEVKISTPKESEQGGWHIGYRRAMDKGTVDYMLGASSAIWDHVYAVPTEPLKADEGTFSFEFDQRRYAPVIKASYDGLGGSIPLEPVGFVPRLDGTRNLKAVNVGKALPEDISGKDISGKLAVVTRDANQTTAQQIKALQAAGAEAVVLVNDRTGIYAASVLIADNIAIPAYTLGQEDGTAFLNRIANGPTLIKLKGIANSPYVYNIQLSWPGVIPAEPVEEVTAENSAVVMNHYRGTKGKYVGETTSPIRPNEVMVTNVVRWIDTPLDREEWYSTGSKFPRMEKMRWLQTVYPVITAIGQHVSDAMWNYLPGDKREQTWLGAAIGQSQYMNAYREGDKFFIQNHEFGDSEPTHWGDFYLPVDDSNVKLFQNGNLVKADKWFSTSRPLDVSPEPATYTVYMDTKQSKWSPLSTTSDITFTFKSARPANGKEDLALLWPRYDFKLDGENKAKGGITDHFDLSFVLQSGATPDIRGVEAEVSTDDGNTWSTAKVQKIEGGHYTVTVKNPASGYVSLRIKGWDANGSKVEQTLIKAYGVR